MRNAMEVDFRDLAAKFDEDDCSFEAQEEVQNPEITSNRPSALTSEAPEVGEGGGEEYEDDDWSSEDEELASALEWADLRDGEYCM